MHRNVVVLCLLLFACHRGEPVRRVPVILISIDTLRSDHLPAYGYRAIATPNIDGLARDGVVFERAFSNVPLTLPSHATIMTGLLPAEHGVRDNAGYRLGASTQTIASLLRAHGYATGGAISAYVLRRDSNIASGFDFYDDRIEFIDGAPTGNLQRDGGAAESLASILAAEGKLDDAAAHAKLALASNAPGAHDVLARIALTRHDYNTALQEAAAMRASPAHELNADVLTAQILNGQGRREDALVTLQRVRDRAVTAHVPLPPRYWFIAGDVLAGLGRGAEAHAAFERAIATDPTDRDAYISLAFLAAATGDRAAAVAALNRMTAAIPASRAEAEQVRRELRP